MVSYIPNKKKSTILYKTHFMIIIWCITLFPINIFEIKIEKIFTICVVMLFFYYTPLINSLCIYVWMCPCIDINFALNL